MNDHTKEAEAPTLGSVASDTYAAQRDHSGSKPAQQNIGLVRLNPNSDMPPPTDHGVLEPNWYSFDLTHRRVQEGGWTHQVTERGIPKSTDLAGVNMRLVKGGFRELHWHLADEWAIMLKGRARVTLFTTDQEMFVDDVSEGDLWLFPAGMPHSIQGLEDDGCEFLLVFDQGSFSEESTFLSLNNWLRALPAQVAMAHTNWTREELEQIPATKDVLV